MNAWQNKVGHKMLNLITFIRVLRCTDAITLNDENCKLKNGAQIRKNDGLTTHKSKMGNFG